MSHCYTIQGWGKTAFIAFYSCKANITSKLYIPLILQNDNWKGNQDPRSVKVVLGYEQRIK